MFEHAIQSLANLLKSYPWVSELIGILPLTLLIDYVNIPPKLHIYQLMGRVPLWNWPVTPTGSRILLDDASTRQLDCALDRFGRSIVLQAMDGRYGTKYYVRNSETIRLVLESLPAATPIKNRHPNIKANMETSNLGIQMLEVVFVSQNQPVPSNIVDTELSESSSTKNTGPTKPSSIENTEPSRTIFSEIASEFFDSSIFYKLTTLFGYVVLFGCFAATIVLELYIATAFLVLMPATGFSISALYRGRPRKLDLWSANLSSQPMRLVVVTEHMGCHKWKAFYGPHSIVNVLLSRPLEPSTTSVKTLPYVYTSTRPVVRMLLRFCILCQWILAIGATATKDWNAFFISFWVLFCYVMQDFLQPPHKHAGTWAEECANLRITRFKASLSSREALLSTLMALNPDSFMETKGKHQGEFPAGTKSWIAPILPQNRRRGDWERAMRMALKELAPDGWMKDDCKALSQVLKSEMQKALCTEVFKGDIVVPRLVLTKQQAFSDKWNAEVERMKDSFYWSKYIPEGIYMATKILEESPLEKKKKRPGGFVTLDV